MAQSYTDIMQTQSWASPTVTFSFLSLVPSYYTYFPILGYIVRDQDILNLQFSRFSDDAIVSFDPQEVSAARMAISAWASVSALHLVEDVGGVGDITFGYYNSSGTEYGFAHDLGLDELPSKRGDVWINAGPSSYIKPATGNLGYATLIHEIGHALGLSHPRNADGTDGDGSNKDYTTIDTVMSYNVADNPAAENIVDLRKSHQFTPGDVYSIGPMALDIAAIQQKYGANTTAAQGGNTYRLDDIGAWACIWDTKGYDTISYSGSGDAIFDLRPANFDAASVLASGGRSYVKGAAGGVTVSGDITNALTGQGSFKGVLIERAIGGSGNDKIVGNDADNILIGNAGNDTIFGGAGDDLIIAGDGIDAVDGGAGTKDIARIEFSFASVAVKKVIKQNDSAVFTQYVRSTDAGVDDTSFVFTYTNGVTERYDRVEIFQFSDGTEKSARQLFDALSIRPTGTGTATTSPGSTGNPTGGTTPDATAPVGDISGTISTSAKAYIGQTFASALEFANDKDWVKIDLTSGVKYHIDIHGQSVLPYGTAADTFFRVRDGGGTEAASGYSNLLDTSNGYSLDFTAGFTGTHFLSLGGGGTNYATVTGGYALNVTALSGGTAPANRAPTPSGETYQAKSQQVIDGFVLTNDSDPDGDALTAVAQTFATGLGGSVVVESNGHFVYTAPSVGSAANDSFIYTAIDGRGGSAQATVTIQISAGIPTFQFSNYDDTADIVTPQAVYGLDGNDWITMHTFNTAFGGRGDDHLVGLLANGAAGTYLVGNEGDDWFVVDNAAIGVSGGEFNSAVADAGFDTLDFSQANGALATDFQQTQTATIGGGGSLGFTGIDQIIGTRFNDTIYSNSNPSAGQPGGPLIVDKILRGGDGADYLYSGAGRDTIFGGNGNDTIYTAGLGAPVDGGAGDDNIRADGTGTFILSGGSGNDTITGSYGNDTYDGGDGNDRIFSEFNIAVEGADYYYASAGADEITDFGGDGDTLDCSRWTVGLNGTFGNGVGLGSSWILSSGANSVAVRGDIESLIATDVSDFLILNSQGPRQSIYLGGGNDQFISFGVALVYGGTGNDVISANGASALFGEEGNDTLQGSSVADVLDGGAGDDMLFGNAGDDILTGGLGIDVLNGGGGSDTLIGGGGNDTLNGGADSDTADYGSALAAITVNVSGGNGTVTGGADVGVDTLTSIEKIIGTSGNDNFFVDSAEVINGGAGANTLYGLSSNATWTLNSATLQNIQIVSLFTGVVGGTVDATGALEFDTLYGAGSGATTLKTGVFGGWLIAEGGTNTLIGGANSVAGHGDIFVGNHGTSSMTGGLGSNIFYVGAGDVVHGNLAATYNWEVALIDNLNINMATDGVTIVTLKGGTSSATAVGMTQFVTIYGGNTGTFDMQTGTGGGWMVGNGGTATMTGHAQAGNSDLFAAGNGTVATMNGGNGINYFYTDGDDVVHGAGQVNKLYVLNSSASVTVGANTSNIQEIYLTGGTNTVNLSAQSGYIYVFGASGIDTFTAGSGGGETFTGGGSANVFKFANGFGTDAISDWATGAGNTIDFTALAAQGVHSMADLQISTAGGNTTIAHVGHGSGSDALVLNGYAGGLVAGNFVFA